MTSLTNFNASAANVIIFFSLSAPSPSISRVNVPFSVATASATYPLEHLSVIHPIEEYSIYAVGVHSRRPILRLPAASRPRSTTLAHGIRRPKCLPCVLGQPTHDIRRRTIVVLPGRLCPPSECDTTFEGVELLNGWSLKSAINCNWTGHPRIVPSIPPCRRCWPPEWKGAPQR
jgi:hypothetical protein